MASIARITIYSGHYGSGKTNLAVNHAIRLSIHGPVNMLDLDIVNPYFRSSDSAEKLANAGVRLIASPYANTNLEAFGVPAEAYAAFEGESPGVIDVGGDDAGAVALGRFAKRVDVNECDMWMVVNLFRPLTNDPEDLVRVRAEIEAASHFRFTGIVHNSNLGRETTAGDILSAASKAEAVSERLRLPIVYTSCKRDLYDELRGRIDNLQAVDIYGKDAWQIY